VDSVDLRICEEKVLDLMTYLLKSLGCPGKKKRSSLDLSPRVRVPGSEHRKLQAPRSEEPKSQDWENHKWTRRQQPYLTLGRRSRNRKILKCRTWLMIGIF
jgi:hypothetical protein